MALPFDRFLNLVYSFATEGVSEEKERDRFDMRLNMPVPGFFSMLTETASPWTPDAETAALSSLAAAVSGGGS